MRDRQVLALSDIIGRRNLLQLFSSLHFSVVSELQGVEKRFNAVSEGFHKKLSKSCNVLGNDVTIMSYVFACLIIFAIVVAIMIVISVYVHRQLRKLAA